MNYSIKFHFFSLQTSMVKSVWQNNGNYNLNRSVIRTTIIDERNWDPWNKRYKLYIYQKIRCCRQLAWEPPRVCTWWTERSQEHYQCLTLWLVSRPLLLSGLYWGASRRLTILPPHLYSALCKAEVVRQSKEIILIRAYSPPLSPPISEIIYKLFHRKIKH